MQVFLVPLSSTQNNSVAVETHSQATVSSLISSFCTQKGIAYDSRFVVLDARQRPLPQYSTLASLGITEGQNLLIGYAERKIKLSTQWPLIVGFSALLIGVVGVLTISFLYGLTGGVYPNDFGVVMDAGSSKTNTLVYKWRSDKFRGTGNVIQVDSCKVTDGIAEMDPMEIEPVINCAKKVVTKHIDPAVREKTPLFFAATAGMRLLNSVNSKRANEILNQVSIHLNETGLSVRAVEIISGEDEGIYGWITVNFLQQTIKIPQKMSPWIPTTYGALDMGGASLQIAYAIPSNDRKHSYSQTAYITLYGQTHNVFSHTNLCFGRLEAERRYRYLLIQNPEETHIWDPCLPLGYTTEWTGLDLFKRPCVNSTKFNSDKYSKYNYTFEGTSEVGFCKGNVSKLLQTKTCKEYNFSECFKHLRNVPVNQEFLAFASYFFTMDFLNVTGKSFEQFQSATNTYCAKNVTEIDNAYNISSNPFLTQYCFNANYIKEVLLNGFGFNSFTWKNIHFADKVADKDVGWTLGYMINATNLIPDKEESPRIISTAGFAVSLVLFIIFILAVTWFLLRYKQKDSQDISTIEEI